MALKKRPGDNRQGNEGLGLKLRGDAGHRALSASARRNCQACAPASPPTATPRHTLRLRQIAIKGELETINKAGDDTRHCGWPSWTGWEFSPTARGFWDRTTRTRTRCSTSSSSSEPRCPPSTVPATRTWSPSIVRSTRSRRRSLIAAGRPTTNWIATGVKLENELAAIGKQLEVTQKRHRQADETKATTDGRAPGQIDRRPQGRQAARRGPAPRQGARDAIA